MKDLKQTLRAITERDTSIEEQSIKLYETKLNLLNITGTFNVEAIEKEINLLNNKSGVSKKLEALYEEVKIEVEEAKLKLQEIEIELLKISEARQKSIDELAIEFDLANREANAKKENLFNHYKLKLDQLEVEHDKEFRRQHRENHSKRFTLSRFLDKYSIIFYSEIIAELKRLTIEEAIKSIKSLEEPKRDKRKISAIEIPDKSIKYTSNVVKKMTDPNLFLKKQDLNSETLKKVSESNPILFSKVEKNKEVIVYNNFLVIASDNDKYTTLTEFDMAIYSQIINLFKEGYKIFSVNDIIRCWKKGVKTTYNKGIVRDIENTLNKLNALDIYLDYSGEQRLKKYDVKNTVIVAQKLLYTHKTWEIPERGRKEREYYTIVEEPPLTEYLDVNIQRLTLNREDYNIPLTLSKKNIVLHDLLLDQIALTRNTKQKVKLKILTISNRLGLSDDLKTLKRLTQDIEELGEFFSERGLLSKKEPLAVSGRGRERIITFNKNPNSQLNAPN